MGVIETEEMEHIELNIRRNSVVKRSHGIKMALYNVCSGNIDEIRFLNSHTLCGSFTQFYEAGFSKLN